MNGQSACVHPDGWHAKVSRTDLLIAVGLAAAQVVFFAVMRATSRTDDHDPFDSVLYWWSWLALPPIVCLLSFARPGSGRSLLWTAALFLPFMIEVALLGTVWFDPDDGASLWIAGEIFIVFQAALTYAAGEVGSRMRARKDGIESAR